MSLILAILAIAEGAELRAVGPGDTVEGIAGSLGDPALASVIRALNDLGANEQPELGRLIELPPPADVEQVEQRALLVSIVGEVTSARAGTGPLPARLHQPLDIGSVVCTEEDSYATLQLASACEGEGQVQDEVTLLDETCVELRSMVASDRGRATVLRVLKGSVVVATPPRHQSGSEVAVQVADGIASGAGGFRAHFEEGGTLRTEALYNPVELLGQGTARELQPGEGARVQPGGQLTDTVQLLRMGDLLRPEPDEALIRPVFTWTPTPDAFGYLLTISGDARVTRVLYQEPIAEPVHRPDLLFLPVEGVDGLWWQVAPLDRFGFLGVPSATQAITVPEGVLR